MSASLVGSEMCIRDRHNPAQSGSRGSQCWHILTRPAAPRRNPAQLAVSYTHLTLPTICSV
eukprot:8860751-Alexandrium_andersonii.AAC.1